MSPEAARGHVMKENDYYSLGKALMSIFRYTDKMPEPSDLAGTQLHQLTSPLAEERGNCHDLACVYFHPRNNDILYNYSCCQWSRFPSFIYYLATRQCNDTVEFFFSLLEANPDYAKYYIAHLPLIGSSASDTGEHHIETSWVFKYLSPFPVKDAMFETQLIACDPPMLIKPLLPILPTSRNHYIQNSACNAVARVFCFDMSLFDQSDCADIEYFLTIHTSHNATQSPGLLHFAAMNEARRNSGRRFLRAQRYAELKRIIGLSDNSSDQ